MCISGCVVPFNISIAAEDLLYQSCVQQWTIRRRLLRDTQDPICRKLKKNVNYAHQLCTVLFIKGLMRRYNNSKHQNKIQFIYYVLYLLYTYKIHQYRCVLMLFEQSNLESDISLNLVTYGHCTMYIQYIKSLVLKNINIIYEPLCVSG